MITASPTISDHAALVSSPPVIMAPRVDGCEVVWSVTAPARGWVEWAPAPDRADDQAPTDVRVARTDAFGFVPQGTEVIKVRVDGMQPGADHVLRTVTEDRAITAGSARSDGGADGEVRRVVSVWKRFRTLSVDAASTSFVVWSDTHQHDDALTRLDDLSPHADFFVWNGDVCNNWTTDDAFADTVLHPAGRDITDGRPMLFTWGNHDVRGPWAYRLREFVTSPNGLPYYGLRSGPVAAVFLHTGEDKPDDHPSFGGTPSFEELRRRQADWLAEQLQQPGFADAPYRLVFCHLPLRSAEERVLTDHDYATGSWDVYARTSRELWHPLLVDWGAQVVISGHQHRPSLLPATAEFPYAQVIGGGWKPEEGTWIEGQADLDALTITTRDLDGAVVHEITVPPYT